MNLCMRTNDVARHLKHSDGSMIIYIYIKNRTSKNKDNMQ